MIASTQHRCYLMSIMILQIKLKVFCPVKVLEHIFIGEANHSSTKKKRQSIPKQMPIQNVRIHINSVDIKENSILEYNVQIKSLVSNQISQTFKFQFTILNK